jgi:hypothetical protein
VLAMLKPSAQDKLGKLLRMLSSDKDGEVLAATVAIRRTLENEGTGIHALAHALCRPEPLAEEKTQRARDTDWSEASATDWHYVACECDERSGFLTSREQKFVADMVTWTEWRAPTEKQQAWLLGILNRVRRHG